VCRLPVTASVVPCSLVLVTPMMEELRSSETSVLTSAARRNIPENGRLEIIFKQTRQILSLELETTFHTKQVTSSVRHAGHRAHLNVPCSGERVLLCF
jgi:hypothetical protein